MKTLRKVLSLFLAATAIVTSMVVCSAGASARRTPGRIYTKIYKEVGENSVILYIDGIDEILLRYTARELHNLTPDYIKLYRTSFVAVPENYKEGGTGYSFDMQIYPTLDDNPADVTFRTKTYGSTMTSPISKNILRYKYYNNTIEGLTSGYCITIKDKTIAEAFAGNMTMDVLAFGVLPDSTRVSNGGWKYKNWGGKREYDTTIETVNTGAFPPPVTPPEATTLSVTKKGRKYTFTWDAVENIVKYQIFYSEDGENFKKLYNVSAAKTSLKKKADIPEGCYFKIRSFKTENGKKYFSDWSNVVVL